MTAHAVRADVTLFSSIAAPQLPPHGRFQYYQHPYPRRVRVLCTLRHDVGEPSPRRREVLLTPFIAAVGAAVLQIASLPSKAEDGKGNLESIPPSPNSSPSSSSSSPTLPASPPDEWTKEEASWRIYDATVIGEPMAMGKNREKVWEKLMKARIVYLGEAEQVPTRDDSILELGIVKSLRRRCLDCERSLTLALEAFSLDLQEQINQFIDRKIDGEALKAYVSDWPLQRWQELEPLLNYCRDNGIRVVACGTPLNIVRTVQAYGIQGLSKSQRKLYVPPVGSGFTSGFTSISKRSVDINANQAIPFVPSSYMSTQAKVVENYTMSQTITQAVSDGEANGMLVVVTGASHVMYGARGTSVPSRVSRKMLRRDQAVILLNPERQFIRREGETPDSDFLWYSAATTCSRNCFDRAEIARVMNAAGRRLDALPQDIQNGLNLGVVSPEVLQNFLDLEQYPLIKELTNHFQGFRERLLADPKFLQRLAIEESISITTTLIAQYERRKENFFDELDYVITDTVRGSVVDFFTVWLPAPTLSYLSYSNVTSSTDNIDVLKSVLSSIPDNAFQKSFAGRDWNLSHRIASVLIGGLKLFGVGFISSIGAVASSNLLYTARRLVNTELTSSQRTIRSPILKTAFIYASFLGISANLRYQVIAGVIEHRISDAIPSQTLLLNVLSFVARTVNSYWGTQQWVDLARYTGLQSRKDKSSEYQDLESTPDIALECNVSEEASDEDVPSQ